MPRVAGVAEQAPSEAQGSHSPPHRVRCAQCLQTSRSPLQPPRTARRQSERPRGAPAELLSLNGNPPAMLDSQRRQQRMQTLQARAIQALRPGSPALQGQTLTSRTVARKRWYGCIQARVTSQAHRVDSCGDSGTPTRQASSALLLPEAPARESSTAASRVGGHGLRPAI